MSQPPPPPAPRPDSLLLPAYLPLHRGGLWVGLCRWQEETQELVRETKILLYDVLSTTSGHEAVGDDFSGIPAEREEGPVLQELLVFLLSLPLSGPEAILHQKVKTLQRRLQTLAPVVGGDPSCLHTSLVLSIAAALDKMAKALAKVNRNRLKLERALVDVKDIHARNMESRALYETYFDNIRMEQNHHASSQTALRTATTDRPQSTRASFSMPSFSTSAAASGGGGGGASGGGGGGGAGAAAATVSGGTRADKMQKAKFTYAELLERRVIVSSEIPADYHKCGLSGQGDGTWSVDGINQCVRWRTQPPIVSAVHE